MAEQQATAELTLRDVLGQVDRRLTLIESDLRDLRTVLNTQNSELNGKIDAQTAEIRSEMNAQTAGLRSEMNAQNAGLRSEAKNDISGLRGEINGLRNEMSTKFRWLTGIVLASWLSVMGTLLLK